MGKVNPEIDPAGASSGCSDIDTDQDRSSSSSSSAYAYSSDGSMESELMMARVCIDGSDNSVIYSQSSLSSGGSLSFHSKASEAASGLSSQMSLASQTSMQSQASLMSQASMQSQTSIQSQVSLASQASIQSQTSLASQASLQSDLSQCSSLAFLPSLQMPAGSGRLSWHQEAEHRCVATVRGEPGGGYVSSLAVEGGYLYAGWSSKEIRVWMLTNGVADDVAPDCGKFGCGDGAVKAIVAAGDKLFSAHQDHKIRVWRKTSSGPSIVEHKLVATIPTVKDYLKTFLPPRNYVLVRRHHRRLWIEHVDTISCLAVDLGRSLLYSASWDRTLKVWRMRDFRCVESIRAHEDAVNALAVAPAGGYVYTGGADGKVKVWARPAGGGARGHSLVATLEAHKSAVNALALSPDENILYSGACDRAIVVWEREGSAQHVAAAGALRGHRCAVLCLAALSDLLCSGSADRTIRVWRRFPPASTPGPSHACIAALRGHSAPVKCLRLSYHAPSRRYVVYSGNLDRDIKIWWVNHPQSNADHDQPEELDQNHSPSACTLAFSPLL